ncbi:adenylate isopentenyltransferase 1, chloroplastic [Beta vulgaris subsp. vulgaris]|uniref:adenylate isopentenyltransferase 1, chloroplastic n=1 Tax=Beta vulgaris subsp. vulgaris TaxID=3555 RepID=UPI002036D7B0|nr:adenylate isopentenyltransferase 1, chloroplastic [Beta vulgaris subsp. vulgaris]
MALSLAEEKVLVIMGPTASGKSRLSVELATRFSSEIINCDKMQVYKGLDITTNKIPFEEQLGIPHHLLGNIDSATHGDMSPMQYRYMASSLISQITARGNLPIIVGGSTSFIYALLAKHYNPDLDIFSGSSQMCSKLRYKCCLLWTDVSLPVLNQYISNRLEDMLDAGMLDELAEFHQSEMAKLEPNTGVAKSIGVPEFEEYFRTYGCTKKSAVWEWDHMQRGLYKDAVKAVQENTCMLAKTQVEKIKCLQAGGWKIKRLDATKSFMALLEGSDSWWESWETQVLEPSLNSVKNFLKS